MKHTNNISNSNQYLLLSSFQQQNAATPSPSSSRTPQPTRNNNNNSSSSMTARLPPISSSSSASPTTPIGDARVALRQAIREIIQNPRKYGSLFQCVSNEYQFVSSLGEISASEPHFFDALINNSTYSQNQNSNNNKTGSHLQKSSLFDEDENEDIENNNNNKKRNNNNTISKVTFMEMRKSLVGALMFQQSKDVRDDYANDEENEEENDDNDDGEKMSTRRMDKKNSHNNNSTTNSTLSIMPPSSPSTTITTTSSKQHNQQQQTQLTTLSKELMTVRRKLAEFQSQKEQFHTTLERTQLDLTAKSNALVKLREAVTEISERERRKADRIKELESDLDELRRELGVAQDRARDSVQVSSNRVDPHVERRFREMRTEIGQLQKNLLVSEEKIAMLHRENASIADDRDANEMKHGELVSVLEDARAELRFKDSFIEDLKFQNQEKKKWATLLERFLAETMFFLGRSSFVDVLCLHEDQLLLQQQQMQTQNAAASVTSNLVMIPTSRINNSNHSDSNNNSSLKVHHTNSNNHNLMKTLWQVWFQDKIDYSSRILRMCHRLMLKSVSEQTNDLWRKKLVEVLSNLTFNTTTTTTTTTTINDKIKKNNQDNNSSSEQELFIKQQSSLWWYKLIQFNAGDSFDPNENVNNRNKKLSSASSQVLLATSFAPTKFAILENFIPSVENQIGKNNTTTASSSPSSPKSTSISTGNANTKKTNNNTTTNVKNQQQQQQMLPMLDKDLVSTLCSSSNYCPVFRRSHKIVLTKKISSSSTTSTATKTKHNQDGAEEDDEEEEEHDEAENANSDEDSLEEENNKMKKKKKENVSSRNNKNKNKSKNNNNNNKNNIIYMIMTLPLLLQDRSVRILDLVEHRCQLASKVVDFLSSDSKRSSPSNRKSLISTTAATPANSSPSASHINSNQNNNNLNMSNKKSMIPLTYSPKLYPKYSKADLHKFVIGFFTLRNNHVRTAQSGTYSIHCPTPQDYHVGRNVSIGFCGQYEQLLPFPRNLVPLTVFLSRFLDSYASSISSSIYASSSSNNNNNNSSSNNIWSTSAAASAASSVHLPGGVVTKIDISDCSSNVMVTSQNTERGIILGRKIFVTTSVMTTPNNNAATTGDSSQQKSQNDDATTTKKKKNNSNNNNTDTQQQNGEQQQQQVMQQPSPIESSQPILRLFDCMAATATGSCCISNSIIYSSNSSSNNNNISSTSVSGSNTKNTSNNNNNKKEDSLAQLLAIGNGNVTNIREIAHTTNQKNFCLHSADVAANMYRVLTDHVTGVPEGDALLKLFYLVSHQLVPEQLATDIFFNLDVLVSVAINKNMEIISENSQNSSSSSSYQQLLRDAGTISLPLLTHILVESGFVFRHSLTPMYINTETHRLSTSVTDSSSFRRFAFTKLEISRMIFALSSVDFPNQTVFPIDALAATPPSSASNSASSANASVPSKFVQEYIQIILERFEADRLAFWEKVVEPHLVDLNATFAASSIKKGNKQAFDYLPIFTSPVSNHRNNSGSSGSGNNIPSPDKNTSDRKSSLMFEDDVLISEETLQENDDIKLSSSPKITFLHQLQNNNNRSNKKTSDSASASNNNNNNNNLNQNHGAKAISVEKLVESWIKTHRKDMSELEIEQLALGLSRNLHDLSNIPVFFNQFVNNNNNNTESQQEKSPLETASAEQQQHDDDEKSIEEKLSSETQSLRQVPPELRVLCTGRMHDLMLIRCLGTKEAKSVKKAPKSTSSPKNNNLTANEEALGNLNPESSFNLHDAATAATLNASGTFADDVMSQDNNLSASVGNGSFRMKNNNNKKDDDDGNIKDNNNNNKEILPTSVDIVSAHSFIDLFYTTIHAAANYDEETLTRVHEQLLSSSTQAVAVTPPKPASRKTKQFYNLPTFITLDVLQHRFQTLYSGIFRPSSAYEQNTSEDENVNENDADENEVGSRSASPLVVGHSSQEGINNMTNKEEQSGVMVNEASFSSAATFVEGADIESFSQNQKRNNDATKTANKQKIAALRHLQQIQQEQQGDDCENPERTPTSTNLGRNNNNTLIALKQRVNQVVAALSIAKSSTISSPSNNNNPTSTNTATNMPQKRSVIQVLIDEVIKTVVATPYVHQHNTLSLLACDRAAAVWNGTFDRIAEISKNFYIRHPECASAALSPAFINQLQMTLASTPGLMIQQQQQQQQQTGAASSFAASFDTHHDQSTTSSPPLLSANQKEALQASELIFGFSSMLFSPASPNASYDREFILFRMKQEVLHFFWKQMSQPSLDLIEEMGNKVDGVLNHFRKLVVMASNNNNNSINKMTSTSRNNNNNNRNNNKSGQLTLPNASELIQMLGSPSTGVLVVGNSSALQGNNNTKITSPTTSTTGNFASSVNLFTSSTINTNNSSSSPAGTGATGAFMNGLFGKLGNKKLSFVEEQQRAGTLSSSMVRYLRELSASFAPVSNSAYSAIFNHEILSMQQQKHRQTTMMSNTNNTNSSNNSSRGEVPVFGGTAPNSPFASTTNRNNFNNNNPLVNFANNNSRLTIQNQGEDEVTSMEKISQIATRNALLGVSLGRQPPPLAMLMNNLDLLMNNNSNNTKNNSLQLLPPPQFLSMLRDRIATAGRDDFSSGSSLQTHQLQTLLQYQVNSRVVAPSQGGAGSKHNKDHNQNGGFASPSTTSLAAASVTSPMNNNSLASPGLINFLSSSPSSPAMSLGGNNNNNNNGNGKVSFALTPHKPTGNTNGNKQNKK